MNRTDAQNIAKQSLDELAAQLENGRSDGLTNFLAAVAKFHSYSWGNVMMILTQKPGATHVAGIRTWNRLGRFVRKGEKGIAIFAPMVFKGQEDAKATDDEGKRIAFRVVHVFDLSQTDGDPLPEPETVTGDPAKHLEDLKRVVSEKCIQLEYRDDLGAAKGVSCKGIIKLLSGLSPAEEFSVLAHELGHELLHTDRRDLDRKRAELEAEAVACILCRYAGLESGAVHSDYIQLYSGSKEALAESLEAIQRTASGIIEAMSEALEALAA